MCTEGVLYDTDHADGKLSVLCICPLLRVNDFMELSTSLRNKIKPYQREKTDVYFQKVLL